MSETRICFITAIFSNYEATCKKFAEQTIPCDFICFTNRGDIQTNGWLIDTTPYHTIYPSPLDNGLYRNSLKNNQHTFNVAKYYKQAFINIPRLAKYDVVVWLDGTIEVTNTKAAELILERTLRYGCVSWNSEYRFGLLSDEVAASAADKRYNSAMWNEQSQPIQPVIEQYRSYRNEGFDERVFKQIQHTTPHLGVWVTCFISFNQRDKRVIDLLNRWYSETLRHTTQDQVSFVYVVWKNQFMPYTLPDAEIRGDNPHLVTDLYIRHQHGR